MNKPDSPKVIFLNQNNIDDFIKLATSVGMVAVDTEFSKSRSYFAILSLIQFSLGDRITYIFDCIDRKNCIDRKLCTKLISNLFRSSDIVKVFHAVSQDSEAVTYLFDTKMNAVMDTQVMSDILKIEKQASYAFLVRKFFGILLDKEYQHSNWLQRPLDEEKIVYASIDVYYLLDLYSQMKTMMTKEMVDYSFVRSADMVEHGLRRKDPLSLWSEFSNKLVGNRDKYIDRPVAKGIFLFRELIARDRNVLSRMVMSDSVILTLADKRNKDQEYTLDERELSPYVKKNRLLKWIKKISKELKFDAMNSNL